MKEFEMNIKAGVHVLGCLILVSSLQAMELPSKTHYEVLGVEQHATEETIRKAYKQRLMAYTQQEKGNFQAHDAYLAHLRTAYSVLTNPKTREEYDASLSLEESHEYQSLRTTRLGIPLETDRNQRKKDAASSEAELYLTFSDSLEKDDIELWQSFLERCEAHNKEYRSVRSCQYLNLLKNCALLFLGKLYEAHNTRARSEIKDLTSQYTTAKDHAQKTELQAKIKKLAATFHTKGAVLQNNATVLLKEITQMLEVLFYQQSRAIELDVQKDLEEGSMKIALIEPAIERLIPGCMEYKKAFLEFIGRVERIDSLHPQEGIACIEDAFVYLSKAPRSNDAWKFFAELCYVAAEKWGKQREIIYMQALALMLSDAQGKTHLKKLIQEDIINLHTYLRAHRLEVVVSKLIVLKKIPAYYGLVCKNADSMFNEIEHLCSLYLQEEN